MHRGSESIFKLDEPKARAPGEALSGEKP